MQDPDCDTSKACSNYYCVDPCLSGTCKATDFCRVMNHRPICGFNYEAPPQVRIGLTLDRINCAEGDDDAKYKSASQHDICI